MHEYSVMAHLLETVEAEARRHGASRITAINLVMGQRSSIVDDSLLFYFDMLAPGTLAEGARLNVRRTKMTFHCPNCAADYTPDGLNFECPGCGAIGQATGEGSELLVETIEIDK